MTRGELSAEKSRNPGRTHRRQVRNVSLTDWLAPYGATNRTALETINVPLFIEWGGSWYGDAYGFLYKAKASKTGTGK